MARASESLLDLPLDDRYSVLAVHARSALGSRCSIPETASRISIHKHKSIHKHELVGREQHLSGSLPATFPLDQFAEQFQFLRTRIPS